MTKERVRPLRLSDTSPKSNGFGGGKVGVALFIAILAVSTASIFIRFAQTDAPSLVIAALRLTFASLALAPIALTRHRAELRSLSRNELLLGLLSGLFLAIHFATWISSLEYTTVASSVVFVSTGPLWVALLSPFFLREPLTRPVLIGMSLALIGGIVVALSDACSWNNGIVCPSLNQILHGRMLFGNFLALIGAWMVAGYLMIGRKLRAKMSLMPYIFLVYGMASVCLLIIVSGYTRKFIRLSLAHVCLDFAISARAAIDRPLNL